MHLKERFAAAENVREENKDYLKSSSKYKLQTQSIHRQP